MAEMLLLRLILLGLENLSQGPLESPHSSSPPLRQRQELSELQPGSHSNSLVSGNGKINTEHEIFEQVLYMCIPNYGLFVCAACIDICLPLCKYPHALQEQKSQSNIN
jgi:hypothetical protein